MKELCPFTAAVTLSASAVVAFTLYARSTGGVKRLVTRFLVKAVKVVAAGKVAAETEALMSKMKDDIVGNKDWGLGFTELPPKGVRPAELIQVMEQWAASDDVNWSKGQASGCVYHGGKDLTKVLAKSFELFALTNPLHPDLFPAVRKMESEVVAMTCSLFGGETTCGTTTSGGTESILMSILAHREYFKTKGITEPELIMPLTAHAAFEKACFYFGVKLVPCAVDQKTFKADLNDMRRKINSNTILLVASAPNFAQGIMDPVEEIAQLALGRKGGAGPIGVHVDCCLGSLVIALAEKNGLKLPRFDFRVKGVTSLSCDIHKYGFAPKGCSVIMYHSRELRQHQYFVSPLWTGGIYATPTLPGSRSGALVAGAWAAMVSMGRDGYMEAASKILKTAQRIKASVQSNPDLRILGDPKLMVVCFTSDTLPIHNIADQLAKSGWNLNTVQHPPAIHIAVTLLHTAEETCVKFMNDVNEAVRKVKSIPASEYKPGMSAQIYGAAETLSANPEEISQLARGFVDILFEPQTR